jgi:peptide/nickel transport system substrate-binding protein
MYGHLSGGTVQPQHLVRQAIMTSDTGYWLRLRRARLSRRRLLAAGAAASAAAGAAAIVGCGDGGSSKNGGATAEPKRGGTLRVGTTLPLSSGLDPQIETGTGLEIFPRVYGYMLHVDPRGESVIYDHASSVEQPDATTYLFKLRPDIKFDNIAPVSGRAVTADDVVASILRFRDNRLATTRTWHTTMLDKVDALDATTVRVTTKRPSVYSLSELGTISAGAIIPKELIASQGDLTSMGIGSGPFRIDAVEPTQRARVIRNDGYYRSPIPYLDAMEWTVFPDDNARVEAFRQQQIDMMSNRDQQEANAIRDSAPDTEVTGRPSYSSIALGFRVDRPPLNDPRVRGAIDLALDRDAMIRDIEFGDADILGPVNGHLADGYWSLPKSELVSAYGSAVPIEERRAAAKALLEAAGAANASFKLQVANIPQLVDVASVVRDQIQRLGLSVELQPLELIVSYTNLRSGNFDASLVSHLPYESADAPTRFYHSAGPDGTTSPFGFRDGDIDRLVERSWGETDSARRQATLLEAQRLMLAARPMIQLFAGTGYTAAWRAVENRRPGLLGSLAQYNYEQWLTDPSRPD